MESERRPSLCLSVNTNLRPDPVVAESTMRAPGIGLGKE
jgi:hypothetical protein